MKLVYGRPYTTKPGTTEVRKIWGGLVPYGKVWRTGADEATLLTTKQPIEIGGYSLAGRHVLAVHRPRRGRHGEARHQQEDRPVGRPLRRGHEKANELARVDLKKSTLDKPVDQFTMAIEPAERRWRRDQDDVGDARSTRSRSP